MRKRLLLGYASICILVIVAIAAIAVNNYKNRITEFVFTPEECERYFSVTPTEFFNEYFPFYDDIGDFRENSYVDKNGDLIVGITADQKEIICEFYEPFIITAKELGIKISEDYYHVSFEGYREDVSAMVEKMPFSTLYALRIAQLMNGTAPRDVKVTFTFVDGKTGETVYEESFREVWRLDLENLSKLSPRNEEKTSETD